MRPATTDADFARFTETRPGRGHQPADPPSAACYQARVGGLDVATLDGRPDEGTWTIREVVHHVSNVTAYADMMISSSNRASYFPNITALTYHEPSVSEDPTLVSAWRPLRLLQQEMEDELARVYADARVEGLEDKLGDGTAPAALQRPDDDHRTGRIGAADPLGDEPEGHRHARGLWVCNDHRHRCAQ